MSSLDYPDTGLDKDQPLREDIRLLGRLLGDTLNEQQGGELFNLVEQIRQLAVRFRRNGQAGARAELQLILSGLSAGVTVVVARAFSYFSLLSNIAEDLHRNRRHRRIKLPARRRNREAWRIPSDAPGSRAFRRIRSRLFSAAP